MKRYITLLSAIIIAVTSFAQTPKYVFYFIGDGFGINTAYASDLYARTAGLGSLNFMSFPVKSQITTSNNTSLVTDSASAGSALACGQKFDGNSIQVLPDGSWAESVTTLAKKKGYGTGVVTSVGINHATPAAFYGHSVDRNDYDIFAEQLIGSKMDFAAGACFMHQRKSEFDNEYWLGKAREAGIDVYVGTEGFKPSKNRVICVGNYTVNESLPYAIDRKEGQSKLADFTDAAIRQLYANYKNGFVLMVEGGKIDYACHSTDIVGAIQETLDMCESIQLALDFAAKHPKETLILLTSDHETGGLTMGIGKYELHPEYLMFQKCSKDALTAQLMGLNKEAVDGYVSWPQVKRLLTDQLGLWENIPVSKKEEAKLTQLYKETYLDNNGEMEKNLYSVNSALASEAFSYVANLSMIKFNFYSHTGGPVGLWAYGAKAEMFGRCSDNTDIPNTLIKIMKLK